MGRDNVSQSRKSEFALTRREWLAASAATLSCAAIGHGADIVAGIDVSDPRNHCCIVYPIVEDPTASPEERAKVNPEEAAVLDAAGLVSDIAASAPSSPDMAAAPQSAPARAAYQKQWSKKTITIATKGNRALLNKTLEVASQWTDVAGLTFQPIDNFAAADVRIQFNRLLGHQSIIGEPPASEAGQATMTLGFDDLSAFSGSLAGYIEWVVLHEFGHMLGCCHEHLRPDVPSDFVSPQKVLDYFLSTGKFKNAGQVQHNIFNRVALSSLIKFSEYDRDSVMNYFLPGFLFKDGKAVGQDPVRNTLSRLDKKFAAFMYPGKRDPDEFDGTDDNGGSKEITTKDSTTTGGTLTVDGDGVSGRVLANGALTFNLSIPAGGQSITVYTEGVTQVVLQLLDASGADVTPANVVGKPRQHGTYDLCNDVIHSNLKSGDYRVKVIHVSAKGGGEFRLFASSNATMKSEFSRLLDSNLPRK